MTNVREWPRLAWHEGNSIFLMRFQPSHAVLCHMPQVCSGCWSFLFLCVRYRVKPKAVLTPRCCQKRGGIYPPSPPRQWWHSERGTDPHPHCSGAVDTGGNTTLQKLVSLLDPIPAKHFPTPRTLRAAHGTETWLQGCLQSHPQMPHCRAKQRQDRLLSSHCCPVLCQIEKNTASPANVQ